MNRKLIITALLALAALAGNGKVNFLYAVADKDNLPSGVTAVAMVAYKSGSNGLAIQLNGSPVKMKA